MSKTARYLLSGCLALVLLVGAFSGGLVIGWLLPNKSQATSNFLPFPRVSGNAQQRSTQQPESSTETLFAPFWEAWNLVHDQYVDQPVNDIDLMRGAIRGMLEALGDQHTSYMDPQQYLQANMPMDGSYDGIGAYVDTSGEFLTIISPMPDSPAEKAGLQPGDQILKLDGEDMTGVDPSLVLRKVLGPAGTKITLTIVRKDVSEPFDVTITRAKITLHSVEGKMLDNGIGYINLSTFGETTTDELTSKLKDIMAQKPKGLILDLRNNGGGYLNTAIDVVSQFIPKGLVMIEQYGDKSEKKFNAKGGGLATEIPLVVLVNKGTASASEITAGAIQDYKRGTLIGETTYGKGSVQIWTPLQNEQGAVRITIARWLTPNGRQIHKVGLEPDIKVELTQEDAKAKKDPQLDRAIEFILQGK